MIYHEAFIQRIVSDQLQLQVHEKRYSQESVKTTTVNHPVILAFTPVWIKTAPRPWKRGIYHQAFL